MAVSASRKPSLSAGHTALLCGSPLIRPLVGVTAFAHSKPKIQEEIIKIDHKPLEAKDFAIFISIFTEVSLVTRVE